MFANVCRRLAPPQQRPEADDGGALAGEAGDMSRNPCFSLPLSFCGPPSGEESAPDGAERRAVAALDMHFLQFPRHFSFCSFLTLQTNSRRSLSNSFTNFDRSFSVLKEFPVSARLCLGAPVFMLQLMSLSACHFPWIWLSRSTSKTDALDDGETPLRFTASQKATTRGVMVSGVMGALDSGAWPENQW